MSKGDILITGAGGTVGLILTRAFLNRGFSVYAIDRSEEGIAQLLDLQNINKNLHILFGDILDNCSLEDSMRGVKLLYIIHCAALKHFSVGAAFPQKVMTENIEAFSRLINLAKEYKSLQKIIVCSSDKAAKPFSAMAASKKAIEDLSRESNIRGVDFVNVRFGNILYSNGSILQKLETCIQQEEPFFIRDSNMTRYILTRKDVVELIDYALEKGNQGDIICLKASSVKITTLVEEYLKKRGASIKIIEGKNSFCESIHESLFNDDEIPYVSQQENFFIYNKKEAGDLLPKDRKWVQSSQYAISEEAIKKIYE